MPGKLKIKLGIRWRGPFVFDGVEYQSPHDVKLPCTICGGDTWLVAHRNWNSETRTLEGGRAVACYRCIHVASRQRVTRGLAFRDQQSIMTASAILSAIAREAKHDQA